jgi:uncharacterized protein YifN (PemK superfamily)
MDLQPEEELDAVPAVEGGAHESGSQTLADVPIYYHPEPGDVLFCNFVEPGIGPYAPPEMVKRRRVIVLSTKKARRTPRTLLVVPLSTHTPEPVEAFHYLLVARYPFFYSASEIWVKGDMLAHVALTRLDPILDRGKVVRAALALDDLIGARRAILHALSMEDLTAHLKAP